VDISENAGVWQAWSREFRPAALSLRASVLPSSVAETLDALDRSFAGGQVRLSATAAAGVIRAQMEADATTAAALVERTREIISRCDGTLIVEAAPPQLKRKIDVFGLARPDVAIMRRLKEQLDPRGTLAPGRFIGRL
jgi:glycolate oxidase FAD binding subunit